MEEKKEGRGLGARYQRIGRAVCELMALDEPPLDGLGDFLDGLKDQSTVATLLDSFLSVKLEKAKKKTGEG